jgi:hypothetical protein
MHSLKTTMDKLIAIDKSLIQGQSATVRELLEGLKGKVFLSTPLNSPITICTSGHLKEILTVVYQCREYNVFHLESGYGNKPSYEAGDIVYADKSDEEGGYVSRGDLIKIIEKFVFELDDKIVISCSYDKGSYPMNTLSKCCKECDVVHIDYLKKDELIFN